MRRPVRTTRAGTLRKLARNRLPRQGFERKVAEGKTKKEALRSLKRQISNSAYRQLLLGAQ
jgi:hypothetical protein